MYSFGLPSSSLINTLGNEISRETVFKLLPALERIVHLGVRHGPGLEPAVENFRNAAQRWSAGDLGRDGDEVDVLAVKIRQFNTGQLLQVSDGPYANNLLAIF